MELLCEKYQANITNYPDNYLPEGWTTVPANYRNKVRKCKNPYCDKDLHLINGWKMQDGEEVPVHSRLTTCDATCNRMANGTWQEPPYDWNTHSTDIKLLFMLGNKIVRSTWTHKKRGFLKHAEKLKDYREALKPGNVITCCIPSYLQEGEIEKNDGYYSESFDKNASIISKIQG